MSEKKRKAVAERGGSKKRAAVSSEDGTIKVRVVPSQGLSKPIIAHSPGVSLPAKANFQTYSNGSEVLIQSSSHPTIDFTGIEESRADQVHLKHYVAVFDPATGELDMVEARAMTVRSQIRPGPKDDVEQNEADVAAAANGVSNYNSRAALTETFGTKKSKKAVQSLAENRLLARKTDGEDSNPLSDALLATMPTEESRPYSNVDILQENKPLPKANLAATTPDAVYTLNELVSPSVNAIDDIDVSDWQECASTGQDIQVRSRFVATRVEAYAEASLAGSEKEQANRSLALKRLRLLRYFLILVELAGVLAVRGNSASGKSIPPTKKILQRFSDPKPSLKLIDGIRRHFVPKDNTMRSFETQRLHTFICALALHLPSRRILDKPNYQFTIEPSDLRDDLGIDDKTIRHYFRELGCRVESTTEAEAAAYGIKKHKKASAGVGGANSANDALKSKTHDVRVAKLRLPLRFPKQSSGRPGR